MELKIEIDNKSGFCHGVVRAVEEAERHLAGGETLSSLGSIVHNETELARLEKRGLKIIDKGSFAELTSGTVLFRAHGEPPESYAIAKEKGINIVDCTCPVVLKLQARVKKAYDELKSDNGQIIIFGKRGHAEVNGLAGQVGGDVTIIQNADELDMIDYTRPLAIFSQTTKDPDEYQEVCRLIKERIEAAGGPVGRFNSYNTICGQVSGRQKGLSEFAGTHDVIVFVSGSESSNGKVLYELCKRVNSRSYKVVSVSQIDKSWFSDGESVGICGATSTPRWQLEEAADIISNF